MITKVISGAQTGADLGGLVAAKLHGIPTGGWIPKGFKTQQGPRPQYASIFNLREHSSESYKDRTWDNIADSDATIRFACDFKSAGERCTLNGIKSYNKAYVDININRTNPIIRTVDVVAIRELLDAIEIVNIAGNSHKTWAGMQFYVQTFLSYVFLELGFNRIIMPKEYS